MSSSFWLALIALNLAAFSFSAAVYGLMVARWVRRRDWILTFLNFQVALLAVALVLVYLSYFTDIPNMIRVFRRDGVTNALVTLLLFFPALAKIFELRKEHRQDERAEAVLQALEESSP